jgi:hypothetical protein
VRFRPYIQDGGTVVVAPPRGLQAGDQRPCTAVAQTERREDYSRGNAGEYVR